MGLLISDINLILNFFIVNGYKIIVGAILLTIAFIAIRLTLQSIKGLKAEVLSYYPFDRFFPQSGRWSVLYFLLIIVILGSLIFLLARGELYLGPA